jgi:hypothetical protein
VLFGCTPETIWLSGENKSGRKIILLGKMMSALGILLVIAMLSMSLLI